MKMPERDGSKGTRQTRARWQALSLGLLAVALAGGTDAARLNYQVQVTALHSDNIDLSEDDEISERVLIPRLSFDVKEEGASVELQARGMVERRFYMGNEFPDENRGEFAGQLNWAMFPERLHFVVEDYLSLEPINFRDGRYPGNVQQVNILLAGPSLFARMGPSTRFRLDLRGMDSHAEVASDFDARRYSAAASLRREMSATSAGSAHVMWLDADFDDPATIDYKQQEAFVRYEGRLRRVNYELDLGRGRLERDGEDDESITVARAEVEWQPNQRNRLRLRGRHQFGDEVQGIIVRLSDPDEELIPDLVDTSSQLVTAGAYRVRQVEADYRYTGERVGFRLRPMHRRFRYIDRADADRTEDGILAQASYRLGPRTNAIFTGSVRDRDFVRDEKQRDHVYSLGFDHQMTRHWGLRGEVFRNERDSDVADSRYEENGALLTVWWKR